ncbi:MAG: glycoside hydrolase family 30 [Daejeonella sp.]|nr:glycoside hydrolase family 30 [Daejeonella sp.]
MKVLFRYSFTAILILAFFGSAVSCKKKKSGADPQVTPAPPVPPLVLIKTDVEFWLTEADGSQLFKKQNVGLIFSTATNSNPTIEVDPTQMFQTIDGFGYTLTGGSATLINGLPEEKKAAILEELFKSDSTHIGVSYIRLSLGASDLDPAPFSYDDLGAGATDVNLDHFNLDKEKYDLIPILKRIVAINPDIKFLSCPWSPPTWMKTNNSFKGGSLKPEYYSVYAKYFVKYIQAMKAEGITIDAITPQNEPLHDGNNPSLKMIASEQAEFIKNHLGPAFKAADIKTKIIVYDHNLDRPDYAISIINDPEASPYVDGSAFHLYAGNISTLTQVHNANPQKHVYFTEQWVGGPGNFAGDLKWHVGTLIIGATRNWSRNVLEWNLAADAQYNPHTDGGCTTCLGALTVSGSFVSRNVAYYVIAHASKFVRPGSTRIASNVAGSLTNVAFKRADGKTVLIVLNDGNTQQIFNIKQDGKQVSASLNSGAVGTYIW